MAAKKYIQLLQLQSLGHRNETIVLSYTLKNSSDLNTAYKNRAQKQLTKLGSTNRLQSYEAPTASIDRLQS